MAGRHAALLVGNSTFENDDDLVGLEGPVNDVTHLFRALTDPQVGLFRADDVTVLPERTTSQILLAAEDFFRAAGPDDQLLLYYSGHGLVDTKRRLYLCGRDTRAARFHSTAVSSTLLNAMIEESPARCTVIVLDCCHAGGADLTKPLAGTGRYLLAAANSVNPAPDALGPTKTSPFTQWLIDGMTGEADADDDGFVTLNMLYEYVRRQAATREPPVRTFQNYGGEGGVPLARKGAATRESTLALSPSRVELAGIEPDQEVAPERILVRGAERWAADTAADWIELRPGADFVDLWMRPRPGVNRANVHVVDQATGAMETVRVAVGVEPAPDAPKLELVLEGDVDAVDVGTIRPGQVVERTLALRNRGGGKLAPRVISEEPWLSAEVDESSLRLRVRGGDVPSRSFHGFVAIESEGGSAAVRVVGSVRDPRRWAAAGLAAVLVLVVGALVLRDCGPDRSTWFAAVNEREGDGGRAVGVMLDLPDTVAVAPDGTVVFTEKQGGTVRQVGSDGRIHTVRGTSGATLPAGIAVGPDGSLYVAEEKEGRVRRVGRDGDGEVVAGGGTATGDGVPATSARIGFLSGLAFGPDGSLFLAELHDNRVRRIKDGTVSTVAGTGARGGGGDGGPARSAQLDAPAGLAVGRDGTLYIAEFRGQRIRAVSPAGMASTVANRNAGASWLVNPVGLALHPHQPRLAVATREGSNRVVELDLVSGAVYDRGAVRCPSWPAYDRRGNLYVSELVGAGNGGGAVRRLGSTGPELVAGRTSPYVCG